MARPSAANNGSSPLTRGTLFIQERDGIRSRFIPAYAGNSLALGYQGGPGAVHPRLRGELV